MKTIKLGKVERATENMKGGYGVEHDGVWYYNYDEAIKTAKEQGLTLPTLQDFLDSGFTKEWTKVNRKLADKLGLELSGYCSGSGNLIYDGKYGSLGSVSEFYEDRARGFSFDKDEGDLDGYYKSHRFVYRPLVKNPIDYLLNWAKDNNITVKAFEELKHILDLNK